MVFLDSVFSPVLLPLVTASPFWGIFVLAFIVTLLMTLAYKYLTNQQEMKRLKEQQKEFSKRMKELRDNPSEMMKVQKEAMAANMEYMKHSLKVTLITLIPILLVFGWMNGHLAYEPIYPEERYSITASFAEGVTGDAELVVGEGTELFSEAKQPINSVVTWNMKSTEGEHAVTVKTKNDQQSKTVLITKELTVADPISFFEKSDVRQIMIQYNKLRPLGTGFSIFGWQPGWLAWYILFSLVFSLGMRKVFKVY